jgi:hypothetical protein
MTDDSELFAAARVVRPFLAELVPRHAAAVDRELSAALLSSDPEEVRLDRIESVFGAHDTLTDWIGQFLAGGSIAPEVLEIVTRSDYKGLAGNNLPLPGTRFVCPNGDYEFSVLRRGQAIRPCPTCGLRLVQAAR